MDDKREQEVRVGRAAEKTLQSLVAVIDGLERGIADGTLNNLDEAGDLKEKLVPIRDRLLDILYGDIIAK